MNLSNELVGHHSVIKFLISLAKLIPISKISASVSSSFDVEQRNRASGYTTFKVFLNNLISNEFP